ncbi:MAG: phytoene/squalene synthase family protein [Sphingobacteriales bacterium]|nr:MAG: phytoene/squalene synthase family protein [Sphingobacteriales bacterium]
MSIALYNITAFACSEMITRSYSTSFALAIKTLDKRFRAPICGIYGFVRFADEIVDTFHDHDKKSLLENYKKETYRAIYEKISLNPVLHAFQEVVNKYEISLDHVEQFLRSMEMDLETSTHAQQSFEEYIYGSAEVVGLMCLQVFCEGDKQKYDSLKPFACKLGSAFQKVNFLRDVQSDFEERGRVYFPGVEWKSFNNLSKTEIEKGIQQDFEEAYKGIKLLPEGARLGVFLAYKYYLSLFRKIQKVPAAQIMQSRIRVSNHKKIALLLQSYVSKKLNYI